MDSASGAKLVAQMQQRLQSLNEVLDRQRKRIDLVSTQLEGLVLKESFQKKLKSLCSQGTMHEELVKFEHDCNNKLQICMDLNEVRPMLADLASQKNFLILAKRVRAAALRCNLKLPKYLQELPSVQQWQLKFQWDNEEAIAAQQTKYRNTGRVSMKTALRLILERLEAIEGQVAELAPIQEQIASQKEMMVLVEETVKSVSPSTRVLRSILGSLSVKGKKAKSIIDRESQLSEESKGMKEDLCESTNVLVSIWERLLNQDDTYHRLVEAHHVQAEELQDSLKDVWVAWARENHHLDSQLEKSTESAIIDDNLKYCKTGVSSIEENMSSRFQQIQGMVDELRFSRSALLHDWSNEIDAFSARFQVLRNSATHCHEENTGLEDAILNEMDALRTTNRRIIEQVQSYKERHRFLCCAITSL